MHHIPAISVPSRYYRVYPTFDRPLGYAEEDVVLRTAETAFVIVDVYGAGFEEEAERGSEDVPGIYRSEPVDRTIVLDRILPAKRASKALGMPVVYLTNALLPGLNERSEWRNVSLRATSVDVLTEWREPNDILVFSTPIAPEADDFLIRKQFYSGFFETCLDSTLRSLGVRNLIVAGFDTRICLGNTVTDAVYRGYRVIVLRDAARTFEYPETRDGQWANFIAIRYIETNVGYTATTDQYLAACKAADSGLTDITDDRHEESPDDR